MILEHRSSTKAKDPHPSWPRYCEHDGKKLIDATETKELCFDTATGAPIRRFVEFRYCEDWKQERYEHTECWSQLQKTEPRSHD